MSAQNQAGNTPAPIAVPHAVLETVVNETPFIETHFRCMGPGRSFYDVIVIKGTFDLEAGLLMAADVQVPPQLSDDYWDNDNPETSSLKAADDLELYKPSTDILVVGSVHSFEGKPRKEWTGQLRVADGKQKLLIDKTLRFTGPRQWRHGLLSGWTLSDPIETTAVPLRYELAYGGYWINPKQADPDLAREVYAQNPSGSGHFGKSHDIGKAYPGPQIEHAKRISASNHSHIPGCFGAIARFWQPRLKHAGTYDDKWLKQFHDSAIPDYPDDFDPRFYQSAPHDQITRDYLRGGEQLQLAGVFGDKRDNTYQLPKLSLTVTLLTHDAKTHITDLNLDTVTVDLDARKVYLLWRIALPHHTRIYHAAIEVSPHPQGQTA